jgi:oxygen-independent coproporphyrinogen-3 oxidase
MYTRAIDILTQGGLEHYEVSNFAKPGQACQHNQTYWNGDRWWAFGPSAASYLGKHRSVNHRGTLNYLRRVEAGETAIIECEELSIDQQWRERFVFGMRQMQGVPWSQWRSSIPEKTRADIDMAVKDHIDRGWLEVHGEYVRLSRAGLVISDGLWSSYFDAP